ncbi:MAG: twin-arginine translocase TatA/TatE family subunit [bacterium]|jgi:TatA/E family protein of Tat protein translocase|nr:twin-arginine translocase TatA/TatE family subunit [bacterium]
MLGIGTGELILILAVILIVFGPQRIPELARYVAKGMKMFQEATRELQRQMDMAEWDREVKRTTTRTKSTPSATATPAKTESSPYEEDNPKSYDHYQETYGYPENWNPDTAPGSGSSDTPATPAVPEEPVDPAKVHDAERAARELQG